jgi:choline dehydrogenase
VARRPAALAGTRTDYAQWEDLAGAPWGWESVAPAFPRARDWLRVAPPDIDDLQPFQRAFIDAALDAALDAGIASSSGLDDPDVPEGVGASPVNIVDGTRWNTAFAYLDPVRSSARLEIRGDTLVLRVVVEAGRARGVEMISGGRTEMVTAGIVVLAAGAYGSAALLLRSGVGAPAELAAVGVIPVNDLPGVGRGLVDHPLCYLDYVASQGLVARMAEAAARGWVQEEQARAKAMLPGHPEPVAVHLFPWSQSSADGADVFRLSVALMAPRSSGRVRLRDADLTSPPLIDHGYLSDADGHDRRQLAVAVGIGHEVGRHLIDRGDLMAGPELAGDGSWETYVEGQVSTYFHPAGGCRMGLDALAVVDGAGWVRGVDGLRVCDASIFPTLPGANPNLPAAMLAEVMAARW